MPTLGGERLIRAWAIGPNDLGIVSRVATLIRNQGGNILRLRSMQLADRFALTLVASFSQRTLAGATAAISQLRGNPLGASFEIFADEIDAYELSREGTGYVFTFKGPDQEGIVERIASLFFHKGLNLEAVTADVYPITYEPLSGTPTFKSEFHTTVPDSINVKGLLAELEREAEQIGHVVDSTKLP